MSWLPLLRVAVICVTAVGLGLAITMLSPAGRGGMALPPQAAPTAQVDPPTATPGVTPPTARPSPAVTATARATATARPSATARATATARPLATATLEPTATASVADRAPAFTAYTVRPGDTLKGIAAAYGVTVADLIAANTIPNPDSLTIGSSIRIPLQQ